MSQSAWLRFGLLCFAAGPAAFAQDAQPDSEPGDVSPATFEAERVGPNTDFIDLGRAAYYEAFSRDVISKDGCRRAHAVLSAHFVPRSSGGSADDETPQEAHIKRTAAADQLRFQGLGSVQFTSDGTIRGKLRNPPEIDGNEGGYLVMQVMVFDRSKQLVPDQRMIDSVSLPLGRLRSSPPKVANTASIPIFLYKEWHPSWSEFPKTDKSVQESAHFAVRRQFRLLLLPKSHPYDAAEAPLKAFSPPRFDATLGVETAFPIAVVGGIEPYEIRFHGLPEGLRWNPETFALEGKPQETGKHETTIEIKDGQFASGDWEAARQAKASTGTPYRQLDTVIHVSPPLEAELVLPRYSRLGQQVSGVCLSNSGSGLRAFHALRLPEGLQIDNRTGRIHGSPQKTGVFPVEVRVAATSAYSAAGEEETVTVRGKWRIVEALPEAKIR